MKVKDLYVCCDNVDSQSQVTIASIGGGSRPMNLYTDGELNVHFFTVKGAHMTIIVDHGVIK